MNIYVWEYVPKVTSNYHDGGGGLIVAKSLDDAQDVWGAYTARLEEEEGSEAPSAYALKEYAPDHSWPTADAAKPKVLVFEDSGCC